MFEFQLLALRCKKATGDCELLAPSGDEEAVAFSCGYTPCVRTYRANVTNRVYNSEEVSRDLLYITFDTFQKTVFQFIANSTYVNNTLVTDCSPSRNATSTHTQKACSRDAYIEYSDLAFSHRYTPSCTWYRPKFVYLVNGDSVGALEAYAWDTLGNVNVTARRVGSPTDNPWMTSVFDGGNLTTSLGTFAESIARAISATGARC